MNTTELASSGLQQNDQPAPLNPQPQPSLPRPSSAITWLAGLVILLFGVLLGGGGFYLLQMNSHKQPDSQTTTATPTPSASPSAGLTQATPTPTSNPYHNWKNYQSPTNLYSFRYPSQWRVEPLITDDASGYYETVVIKNDNQIVAKLTTYLDGTGCGDLALEHPGFVGTHKTTYTSNCGDAFHSVTASTRSDGVWAKKSGRQTKEEGVPVKISLLYGKTYDQALDLLGQSITGLTPVNKPAN